MHIELRPDQRSDEALTLILRQLADAVRVNAAGFVEHRDPECLHDLRVAVRRTRCALTQLKKVLSARRVAGFADEFKWLGTVTNRCRDLDVWFGELEMRSGPSAGHAKNLSLLIERVAEERENARREVTRALRSKRCRRLLDGWSRILDSTPGAHDSGPKAGVPVQCLAGRRILKAYNRMLRREMNTGAAPTSDALHRLRIDAKKYRYLLEFFRSLYPEQQIATLITALKRLQDTLGEDHDKVVQRAWLARAVGELDGTIDQSTRSAIVELDAVLAREQFACRAMYRLHLEPITSTEAQLTCRALFSA